MGSKVEGHYLPGVDGIAGIIFCIMYLGMAHESQPAYIIYFVSFCVSCDSPSLKVTARQRPRVTPSYMDDHRAWMHFIGTGKKNLYKGDSLPHVGSRAVLVFLANLSWLTMLGHSGELEIEIE